MTKISLLIFVLLLVHAMNLGSGGQTSKYKPKKPAHCKGMLKCLDFKRVKPGSTVKLVCPLKSANYSFYKDSRPIATNKKYDVSGRTLKIKKFNLWDVGEYECRAQQGNGSATDVEWFWMLYFKNRPNAGSKVQKISTKVLLVGEKIDFNCWGKNFKLYYSKTMNGTKRMLQENNRLMRENSWMFRLTNLNTKDTGYYHCGRVNQRRRVYFTTVVNLTVIDQLPRIVYPKDSFIQLKEGDLAQFSCSYKGPETISWYKNNKRIKKGVVKKTPSRHLILTISNVTTSDAGTYQCGTTVGKRKVTASIVLDVFAFIPFPYLTRLQGGAQLNDSASIFCQSNNGNATYELLKQKTSQSKPVKVQMNSRNYLDTGVGVFFISKVKKRDEGQYTCRATSNITITVSAGTIWFPPTKG